MISKGCPLANVHMGSGCYRAFTRDENRPSEWGLPDFSPEKLRPCPVDNFFRRLFRISFRAIRVARVQKSNMAPDLFSRESPIMLSADLIDQPRYIGRSNRPNHWAGIWPLARAKIRAISWPIPGNSLISGKGPIRELTRTFNDVNGGEVSLPFLTASRLALKRPGYTHFLLGRQREFLKTPAHNYFKPSTSSSSG